MVGDRKRPLGLILEWEMMILSEPGGKRAVWLGPLTQKMYKFLLK
jgi:hypothetical protein